MFIEILLIIAKLWKQIKCPLTDEWIYICVCVCVCVCVCLCVCISHKKNEVLPFVITYMNLEGVMLSEISQTKTSIVYFHLYMESTKTKQINKYNKSETDSRIQRTN